MDELHRTTSPVRAQAGGARVVVDAAGPVVVTIDARENQTKGRPDADPGPLDAPGLWLSRTATAAALGVSTTTLGAMSRRGAVPEPRRLGGQLFWRRADVAPDA